MMALRTPGRMALVVALIALVSWGCDSNEASQPRGDFDLSIEPEQSQYTLNPDAQVDLTIANTSSQTLYLPVCGPDLTFFIERYEGIRWEPYRAFPCLAIYLSGYHRAVEPGASVRISALIGEAGWYRVQVSYATSQDAEELKTVESDGVVVRADS